MFFPTPLRIAWTIGSSLKDIKTGLTCLFHGQIKVPVLDAVAITSSMLVVTFSTAASVMFLLDIGDTLEEWTHRKSVADLAQTLTLQVDKVWVKNGQQEELVDVSSVQVGNILLCELQILFL